MFVGKARSLPMRTTPEKMLGRLQPYSQTLDLAGKALPGTNTLAYYENFLITDGKGFIILYPGGL
jgi:hypothetical protein